jgi:hypothetical protein
MYHSWGSQNAWLRQIHGENALYVPGDVCDSQGLETGDWALVSSQSGEIRVKVRAWTPSTARRCGPGTPSASAPGAWALTRDAPEATRGFLLNHLIDELLPPKGDGRRWANSDPITGQAAWFDLAGVDPQGSRPGQRAKPARCRRAKQPGRTGPANVAFGRGKPDDQPSLKPPKNASAWSSISTPASAAMPVRSTARNGTQAQALRRWPMSMPMAPTCPGPGSTASTPSR